MLILFQKLNKLFCSKNNEAMLTLNEMMSEGAPEFFLQIEQKFGYVVSTEPNKVAMRMERFLQMQ